ncbi:glycosyltransferase family 2 protein [Candidatus Latescibacterota bacterium]
MKSHDEMNMNTTADKNGSFKVSVVVPSYNEGGNIGVITEKLTGILRKYRDYEIIFVDDGSTDDTLVVIRNLAQQNEMIKYLSFSRNFGHQNALKAGLDHASGDCIISMDADMQHPPELIDQMIEKWRDGFEVVYTLRNESPNQSYLKRLTSSFFYKILNALADIKIEEGAADFRLLDRSVVEVFKDLNEYHLFIRGIIPWMGFRSCSLRYEPNERYQGTSKYSITKMFVFAIIGLTSFSIKPLRLSILFGVIVSFAAFLYAIFALVAKFYFGMIVTGWTSLILSILFIGGIQLVMLGILGEYIGMLFMASKKRPNYIVRDKNIQS